MKENFDDILKRRWEERSFPVDDGHRAEMIELLHKQKRRRAFPFWWFGGLAVLMVAGGFLLFAKDGSMPPENLPRSNEEHQTTPSGKTEIAATSEERAKHENEETSTATTATTPTTTIATSSSSTKKLSGSSTSNKTNTQQVHKDEKVDTKKPDLSAAQTNGFKSTITSSNDVVSPSSKKAATPVPVDEKFYTVDEHEAQSYTIVSVPVTVEVEPDDEMINMQEVQIAQSASQRSNFSTQFIDPLLISGIDYQQGDQPTAVEPKQGQTHPFFLFGELGTGLVFASKPDFNSGWKLRAGAGLGYRLGSKMQLTLAGGYLMQHGGFDFQRTSTVNTLGFSFRSNFNTLTPKTLHYIYARVGAQYRMQRHIIAVHGGAQYLYGAYGSTETQTNDALAGGTVSVVNDSWVKTDGLQTLLWTGDIAYGYQFTPRLSVMIGTDIIFSEFTVKDPDLTVAGYYWKGAYSALQPFVTLNYLIHGHL